MQDTTYKIDAPSGTANYLAQSICASYPQYFIGKDRAKTPTRKNYEIGIHALRGGKVYGEHTIKFLGDEEELSITHKALHRDLFARGALALSRWLANKDTGIYTLEQIAGQFK